MGDKLKHDVGEVKFDGKVLLGFWKANAYDHGLIKLSPSSTDSSGTFITNFVAESGGVEYKITAKKTSVSDIVRLDRSQDDNSCYALIKINQPSKTVDKIVWRQDSGVMQRTVRDHIWTKQQDQDADEFESVETEFATGESRDMRSSSK